MMMVLANRSFSSIFYYYYVFKYRSLDVVEEGVQSARERDRERGYEDEKCTRTEKKEQNLSPSHYLVNDSQFFGAQFNI